MVKSTLTAETKPLLSLTPATCPTVDTFPQARFCGTRFSSQRKISTITPAKAI
jgi:hypothetical protein